MGLIISSIVFNKVNTSYMFLGFGAVGACGIAIMFFIRNLAPASEESKALTQSAEVGSLAYAESDPLTSGASLFACSAFSSGVRGMIP